MSSSEFFDGREMLMVHRAFRREFILASGVVRRVDDGDTLRCRIVSSHLQFITTALHDHHALEDGTVWPALLPRIPGETARHVRKVEGQHSALDVAAAAMSTAMASWGLAPRRGRARSWPRASSGWRRLWSNTWISKSAASCR